jgi:potassium efflux system protein
VFVAVFWVTRRQMRGRVALGDDARPGVAAFDRPFAAALLVSLFIASSPYSGVSQNLRNLFQILTLAPAVWLIRPVIDSRLVPVAHALGILFAVDRFRQTIGGVPVLEQLILVLELLAGMAVAVQSLTVGRLRRESPEHADAQRLHAFRVSGVIVLLLLGSALAAGAVGYLRLARLIASGLLGSGALALMVYAGVCVVAGLMAFTLRVWPLRLLHMVQNHGPLLERRAYRVLIWAALVGWALRSLDYVGLLQPAQSLGETILAAQLGRGSITFTVGNVLEFVLTIGLAYLLSVFIRFVLQEDVYPHTPLPRGVSYALSSLLNYMVLALGFLLALGVLGLDLSKVTILAGAFGVGIGFGLQSVVNNFVSGLIVLFERPIHVGDVVEVGTLQGEVSRIGMRASTVRTWQGAEIIVPNAQLVTERVTNWTRSDRRRRIDLPVGVDYGSAPENVVKLLERVAQGHTQILKIPPPQAVFVAFGDSSINFELRAWTDRFERWPAIATELAIAVYAALRAAGMKIPFAQHEVRLLHDTADRS